MFLYCTRFCCDRRGISRSMVCCSIQKQLYTCSKGHCTAASYTREFVALSLLPYSSSSFFLCPRHFSGLLLYPQLYSQPACQLFSHIVVQLYVGCSSAMAFWLLFLLTSLHHSCEESQLERCVSTSGAWSQLLVYRAIASQLPQSPCCCCRCYTLALQLYSVNSRLFCGSNCSIATASQLLFAFTTVATAAAEAAATAGDSRDRDIASYSQLYTSIAAWRIDIPRTLGYCLDSRSAVELDST